MTRDNRYTVTLERVDNIGRDVPVWVARFAGRVIDWHNTEALAWSVAEDHQSDRLAPRTRGVMQAGRISQGVQHG